MLVTGQIHAKCYGMSSPSPIRCSHYFVNLLWCWRGHITTALVMCLWWWEMEVPVMLTMYSMLLAAGLTEDRALLCSRTHSSMKLPSVISGSKAEPTPESRILQANSSISTVLPMLRRVKRHKQRHRNYGLWNTLWSARLEQEVSRSAGRGCMCCCWKVHLKRFSTCVVSHSQSRPFYTYILNFWLGYFCNGNKKFGKCIHLLSWALRSYRGYTLDVALFCFFSW